MNDTESCQACDLLTFCLAHGPLPKLPTDSHPIIIRSDCSNCGKSLQALAFPPFSSIFPSDLLIQLNTTPRCTEGLFRLSRSGWIQCSECQKGED
jgi:hypothetical protein